jgi:hypothetical protein
LSRFAVLLAVTACARGPEPPARPGEPIPAEPDLVVGTMTEECDGLTAAVTSFAACPNLEPEEKTWARAVIEAAEESFEAAKKAAPDDAGARAIAIACHKAATSIHAATTRCLAGPRPKGDY